MRVLSTTQELVAFHSALTRSHPSAPLLLDDAALRERIERDEERRLEYGLNAGYLTKHDSIYRYSWRVVARTLLDVINPARPLASQRTIGRLAGPTAS